MDKVVTVGEKKAFLTWLLNNKTMKSRECKWILNFLESRDDFLEHIYFVTKDARLTLLENRQRLVQMSTKCSDLPPLKFFKETMLTIDAEKAFHDIRLNADKPLFINIEYAGIENCCNYFMIQEDDEITNIILGIANHEPKTKKTAPTLSELQEGYTEINHRLLPTINSLLDNITHEIKVKIIKSDIDLALENNDKELFIKLSSKLIELNKPEKLFEIVK